VKAKVKTVQPNLECVCKQGSLHRPTILGVSRQLNCTLQPSQIYRAGGPNLDGLIYTAHWNAATPAGGLA